MLNTLSDLKSRFDGSGTIDERVDLAYAEMRRLGFSAMIYDYTPVPLDLDGRLITPSLLRMRDVHPEMYDYWCERGYYQIDPVQQLAVRSTMPFVWNYRTEADTPLARFLTEDHRPVVRFVFETGIVSGVTIPVHMPRGDYATLTGILGDQPGSEGDAERALPDFTLLAHVFHEAVFANLDDDMRRCARIRLTARERECLCLSAEGLSAKEISLRIGRSVPTAVMHLNAAARKLGARNRVQAVVRAAHYRLLD